MFDLACVVRNEEGLTKMQEVLAGLHERYAQVGVQDKGSVYNTDLMEAVELGFLLDCAETLVVGALARGPRAAARHFREDHPLRDDANWLKHSLAYRRGRRVGGAGVQAREDGTLRADGAEVLMTTAAEVLQGSERDGSARRTTGCRSRSRSAATTRRSPTSRGGTSSGEDGARPTGCSTRCTR